MGILAATYLINDLLMIAIPIGLTIYLTNKFRCGWRLFWIGAATFIFSQILHIPFNALINPLFIQFSFIALPLLVQHLILACFLGLSAGVFEELSRYMIYRWWAKDARSWGTGLLLGIGHGGAEAIILGILALYGYVQMLIVKNMDITSLVTPDRVELAKAQIQAYWSTPAYMSLLGSVERLFAITIQLACSILVLQAFIRKKFWWVIIAVLFHGLVDGATVYMSQIGKTALEIEGIAGAFAIASLGIIIKLYKKEPAIVNKPRSFPQVKLNLDPIEENKVNLDKTRFN